MAKGEQSFKAGGDKAKKRTFDPFEAGDRDLKVMAETVEIKKADPSKKNPKPVSYINCAFEALGTALEEGGKNRRVYHRFFTKMEPGKDGIVTPETVDQINGLLRALGREVDLPIVEEAGQKVVSPLAIKKFLQSIDGEVVKARVGIQKGTAEYPDPKNVIKEFYEQGEGEDDEADDSEEDEEKNEESEDEDEDEGEGEDSDDEGDEDEDEDEDLKKALAKKKNKKK
jgi:hypothetical protein